MAGGRLTMRLLTTAVGIPVGIVTQRVVEQAWVAAHPDDPPKLLDDRAARWTDAVAWAALSAAGLALTEILTRRIAETGYRTLLGTEPPPPKPTRAEKKAEKKLGKELGESARGAADTSTAPA